MLKELRKKAGLTQTELAEKIGATQNTVSNWEKGIAKPDIVRAPQLAAALKVSVETVVECFIKED